MCLMKRSVLYLLCALLLCSCGASRTGGNAGNTLSPEDRNTGSVSKIKVNDAQSYNNIFEYLRGKVAGVEVVGESIRIRGLNTATGNPDALIIVDGMETSDISGINPADVDSVEILKDGTAALYGARGANGVVIINLKGAGND